MVECALQLNYKVIKSVLVHVEQSKKTITDNLLAIHGCFECNTYCVTVLARLNEERKEKMNNSEFQLFTVHWLHEYSSWTLIVRLGQYMTAASIGFRH